MSNLVYVVGLGPGNARFLTAQAQAALQAADVLCGYTVYIDLVRPLYPDKEVYTTGMTKEIDRCRWALETRILPAALVKPVLIPSAPGSSHRSLLWLRRALPPAWTVLVDTVLAKMGFSMA